MQTAPQMLEPARNPRKKSWSSWAAPILWGVLVFVNLQAAFPSPPVAMSAFYLKGVASKHVTLNQIFYVLGMTLWLPRYLYGG